MIDGNPSALTAWHENLDLTSVAATDYITASPNTLLRDLIRIRHATDRPAILVDEGKIVGVVGGNQIFEGMLRQNTLASHFSEEQKNQ